MISNSIKTLSNWLCWQSAMALQHGISCLNLQGLLFLDEFISNHIAQLDLGQWLDPGFGPHGKSNYFQLGRLEQGLNHFFRFVLSFHSVNFSSSVSTVRNISFSPTEHMITCSFSRDTDQQLNSGKNQKGKISGFSSIFNQDSWEEALLAFSFRKFQEQIHYCNYQGLLAK